MREPGIVIVGGGVMGCSTAFWLARRGLRCTLVEKESIAWGASGVSAGMMEPVEWEEEGPLGALARESYRLHRQLAEFLPRETGIDTGFRLDTAIIPAYGPDEAEELRREARALSALGKEARWVERDEALSAEPRLNPDILGGMTFPMAQVLAYRFVLALWRYAESRGSVLRHGTVVGLEHTGRRVTGVRLASGEVVPAEVVVIAGGPWASEAERWLGVPVPVYPVRGQVLHLRIPDPQLRLILYYQSTYILRKADGTILVGATEEHDSGYDPNPTEKGREFLFGVIMRLAPSLAEGEITAHVAGLRPCSRDRLPIIGPAPGWEGVYLVTGHFRSGLFLNTASGKAVADLIVGGRADIPLEAFSPARFVG